MGKFAQPMVDVTVAVPSYNGQMCFETYMSLQNLMAISRNNGIRVDDYYAMGSDIAQNRNTAAQHALKVGAKWLLFVDTDMVFPPDGLKKLMERGCKVVGGLYFGKKRPHDPVCGTWDGESWQKVSWNYPKEMTGLHRVDGVGGGFMLVHTSVFKAMKLPYFFFPEYKESVAPQGEDYTFCRKAAAAGFEIYVDLDLKLGHVGSYTYSWTDYMFHKRLLEAANAAEKRVIVEQPKIIVPASMEKGLVS